ncbi:MAG: hypothetical protein R3B48_16110 [Kofleriaceae bacterium]
MDFLVQRKPGERAPTAPTAPSEAAPVECAKCASKAAEKGRGCAHSPGEACAKCSGKQAKAAEVGCAHSPFEACASCAAKSARGSAPREGDDAKDAAQGGDAADGKAQAEGGGDCEPCRAGEIFAKAMVQRTQMPAEGQRPLEAGWWTGTWYTGSNTIMCDGAGAMTIHEATNYPYGVQECTVKHESVHKADWYARYGKDVCKGRKKGDLPYFDPPGKEAYSSFLKKSECKAWKVGESCRKEKLKACKDDTCKKEVQGHVDWAAKQVKNYCG